MKRITIWGAWYGSRNVGDQALLLTIINLLSETWPHLKVYVISDRPHHVTAYTSGLQVQIKSLHSKNPFSNIWAFFKSDVLIFGGGVPIFETNKQLITLLSFSFLCRLFRTKIMTWSISSQIISSQKAKWVLTQVFRHIDFLTCRDRATQRLIQNLLEKKGAGSNTISKQVTIVADPVISMRVKDREKANDILGRTGWDEVLPLAALTPRILRSRDGEAETHYNPKTNEEYQLEIDVYCKATTWLWQKGYQPIIIPMNTVSPDDDCIAGAEIQKQIGEAIPILMVDEALPPEVVPAVFERCALSLVSRVHASICCMVATCPILMYSFAPKHRGVMEAMELEDFILDETDALEHVLPKLEKMHQDHDTIRQHMAQKKIELNVNAHVPVNILRMAFDHQK